MVKIPVSELKEFLSRSKAIPANGLLPITDYIKLVCEGDVITLTKTNLNQFITHQVEGKFNKNFTLLIDLATFATAVSESEAEEMKISFKEQKADNPARRIKIVIMEDGIQGVIKCQSEDESVFPSNPSYDKDNMTVLSPDIIEALFLSAEAALPLKGTVRQPFEYVHIKNMGKKKSYICGFSVGIMYFKWFKENLPDMVLEQMVCTMLGNYQGDGVTMYRGEKYDFFDTGKSLYGFIQTEMKGPDFASIINAKDDEKSFTIDRKSLMAFCKLAIGINPSSLVDPCFIQNAEENNAVVLDYENNLINRSCKKEVEVKKNKRYVIKKFLFNPNDMLKLLKSLSFETVTLVGPCGPGGGNFYIVNEEDADYCGCIREMVLNNEQQLVRKANED